MKRYTIELSSLGRSSSNTMKKKIFNTKKHEFNFSMPENYPLAVQSSSNDPLHAAATSATVQLLLMP